MAAAMLRRTAKSKNPIAPMIIRVLTFSIKFKQPTSKKKKTNSKKRGGKNKGTSNLEAKS